MLTFILTAAGIIILVAVLKDKRKKEYDDDFGNTGVVLSRFNKGFIVNGTGKLSETDSFRNLLVVGGVGSGKSTAVCIPFLKTVNNASIVVNDPSGELLGSSYNNLIKKGYSVRVVQFRKPDTSAGFNVLARAKTNGQINRVSKLIVESTLRNTSDQFWNSLSISLIGLCIQVLPPEYRNLLNVKNLLELLHARPQAIDALFSRQDEKLYNQYASFLGFGEKIISGVVANCIASLQILSDDDVARVLSHDTLGDFSDFRKKKTALFLINNTLDTDYLKFAVECLIYQILEERLSTPADTDTLPLYLVLDEFGSSMRIPHFEQSIAVARKSKIGCLMVYQSTQQIFQNYNKGGQTILDCAYTKLYLPGGLDLQTAQMIEKRAGKFEFEDEKGHRRIMEVITAPQVMKIAPETGILDMGNFPIMKISLTPWYRQMRFMGQSAASIIDLPCELPTEVPLFNPEHIERKLHVSGR